ncbi:hypothetical protein BDV96DRAFT_461418, partial [Lophiotrema nucula]
LAPLPQPGLTVFHGYTAHKFESIVIKETMKHFLKEHYEVSFQSGHMFLEITQDTKRGDMVYKETMTGVEVMRIVREGKNFKGVGSDGFVRWEVKLKKHFLGGIDYYLTIHPYPNVTVPLEVRQKALGQDKAIFWNGTAVATMSRKGELEHFRRREMVYVAPGMDMLVALGVAWIRIDKNNKAT